LASKITKEIEAKKKRKTTTKNRKISVIISGMPSVGKTTAAEAISKRFGLTHIAGGDMLREMAIEKGYEPKGPGWWDSQEGMKFLRERDKDPRFDEEVDRKLIDHVCRGGVVITSYDVPWLTSNGLKIWFSASQRARARRLAGRDKISYASALKIIRERDSKNKKLYSKLYNIDFGRDLSVFNYVIDTENMTAKQVIDAAIRLVASYKDSISH
jgi:cytidylate kinase